MQLISLLCIAATSSIAAADKPNIVFVMIDDLGAEQVGCYGSETYKTPHIDKLATKGMLFNNAFAQPMCQISRATLMTGQYGFRNGFPKNNDRPLNPPYSPSAPLG
ncbi:sulfatase-like hydrolase/transferase [Neorhodopirellula pilleata]|nr:sulfatase-like hydrolase/transferase [Neorhodopirellula pilleata]